MAIERWDFGKRGAGVVGSIGDLATLRRLDVATAVDACDLVELRLDLFGDGICGGDWADLRELPLLMTARREDEGGAKGVPDESRFAKLAMALEDAAIIDLEVASIEAAGDLLRECVSSGVPWVASFHDFNHTPEPDALREKLAMARDAGAAAFKAAAMIRCPGDIARLADFQLQDHGIPVATMGMGSMAAVSRLLCAQCGSMLNYGYLGATPTAPGQWSAAEMKSAIRRLPVAGD